MTADPPEDARLRWLRFPVAIFVVHRALLFAFAWLGLRLTPQLFVPWPAPFSEPAFHTSFSGMCRWDCGLYYHLARRGYATFQETQTFPLYPLFTRAIAAVTGMNHLYALVVTANLAALGAVIVVYRLFWRLSDRDAARWGVTLLLAYPFAFFHAAGFAESQTIFFAALSLLLALDKRYYMAGLALALGTATRHVAVFAGASLLAFMIEERGWRPRALLLHRSTPALLLPLLGIGTYAAWCYARFRDPLAFVHARTFGAPNNFWQVRAWWNFTHAFREGRLQSEPLLATYVFWASFPLAGALGLLARRQWRTVAPYALLLTALYWSTSIMGLGRFSASVWPAFLPLGWFVARRQSFAMPLVLLFGIGQGFFFYMWSHWYGIW